MNQVNEQTKERIKEYLKRLGTDEELAGGHMTVEQLEAMLNTIPLEITFVDTDNINRYFNEGPKVFKRPGMALDREVFSCHPPKVEQQVRRIIGEFREETLDKVPIWMDKNGRTMLVTYMAVRNRDGVYESRNDPKRFCIIHGSLKEDSRSVGMWKNTSDRTGA